MTVGMYARKKNWPLERVTVGFGIRRYTLQTAQNVKTREGMLDRSSGTCDLRALKRRTALPLLEIANKCPGARTLTSEINIRTRLL